MIKKIYAVKETCPMYSEDYEVIKYPLLTSKKEAEQFKIDLEMIDAEKVTCNIYKVVEFELSNNYKQDKYDFHKAWVDMSILDESYYEDFELEKDDSLDRIQACKEMNKGQKITHRNFSNGEFYYIDKYGVMRNHFDIEAESEWEIIFKKDNFYKGWSIKED